MKHLREDRKLWRALTSIQRDYAIALRQPLDIHRRYRSEPRETMPPVLPAEVP